MYSDKIINNILGKGPRIDIKSRNMGNVWTKSELEEIMSNNFPSFNEDEKRLFMKQWLGQPKG